MRRAVEAALLTTEDARWIETIDSIPHDVYHRPEYARFAADAAGGKAAAFFARSGASTFLAPLVLQPMPVPLKLPATWKDATSPYGYASPLISSHTDAIGLSELLTAVRTVALEHECIAAFFRFHPLWALPNEWLAASGTVTRHGQTVGIDLLQSTDQLTKGIRSGYRYDIRRLANAGFSLEANDWTSFGDFVGIYQETMRRVGAAEHYLFSRQYFDKLRQALGQAARLVICRGPDRQVAAAALFSEYRGIAQYLFSGTAESFVKQAPTKLIIHDAIFGARERGNAILHLGGGVGGRVDSLFNFKAGFGQGRFDFHTWSTVWDEERFRRSNERWSELAQADLAESFFPPYRVPLTAGA